ncbi:hypothetical protein [Leptolyngbya sp. CCY15150]|uniref:hypothetical protein n=1 Tax=Leptolyngbya sp. CCY15150 TaxID=2767772 RepID=UPI001EF343AD|nr:hypothetical protein [Leptolyngbya sp. CCY15150]
MVDRSVVGTKETSVGVSDSTCPLVPRRVNEPAHIPEFFKRRSHWEREGNSVIDLRINVDDSDVTAISDRSIGDHIYKMQDFRFVCSLFVAFLKDIAWPIVVYHGSTNDETPRPSNGA